MATERYPSTRHPGLAASPAPGAADTLVAVISYCSQQAVQTFPKAGFRCSRSSGAHHK